MYGNASCMRSLALLRNSNGSLQFLFVCFFMTSLSLLLFIYFYFIFIFLVLLAAVNFNM